MKIAIFTDTYTPQVNGVAKTLQQFTEYLEANGVEYRLFVPDTEEDLFSNQIIRFTSFPFFLYPECRLSFPNVFHVKKELEDFRPDIIHIATPFNMGLTGLIYAKKLTIPMVGSYHTHFDRYLKYYDLEVFSKWLWKYMYWFHSHFQKTFVPSEETRRDVVSHGISNVHIWSRGVDSTKFQPRFSTDTIRKKYQISSPYILSFVGRLSPEKDVDVLMEIAHQLPDKIKEKAHWIIAGDGPQYVKLYNDKPPNMTFTGYLKGEELAELFAASNLFVFPSRTETFGNVVLEAHACGTPAIVAKAGGVQEIVQDGRTGLFCEPGNVDDFVEKITSLIVDETQMKLMGLEARNYALSKSWDTVFESLLAEYTEVIGDNYELKQRDVVSM